jgi:energy-coupling factor transport system substrate-specific component
VRLAAVSLVGLLLFAWPFLGAGLPPDTPAIALALGTLVVLLTLEAISRRLDSRLIALLAVLAAVDAALRMALVTGVGGFSPVFFLILCAGYVFGPTYGFLCGGTALVVSALATGGVGPWLPYQVYAAGWVGALAGLAGLRLSGVWPLAAVGLVSGFGFGALMDIWDWTFFRGSGDLGWLPELAPAAAAARFAGFYLVSSLAYDSFRAVGNVVLVLLLGTPVIAALTRLKARLTVEIVAEA